MFAVVVLVQSTASVAQPDCPGTLWGPDCGYPGPLNTSTQLYAYVNAVCSGQTVCDLTEMRWNASLSFDNLFSKVKEHNSTFNMTTVTKIDISNLNLNVYNGNDNYPFQFMFEDVVAEVNVSGTIIKNAVQMFHSFNGTLVGTPTFVDGADLQYMFFYSTTEHASVDLSHWNMSAVAHVNNMFKDSNSRVNVSGTGIKRGYHMFFSFNGTLVGTPTFADGADLTNMFDSTTEHASVDLSHWNMSAVGDVQVMFFNSKATVNVSGTIIKEGLLMFSSFNGSLVGTPTFAAGADLRKMFLSTPEHLSVDMSHWNMSAVDLVLWMFDNCNSTVNVSGTIIKRGDQMFDSFNGTLVGTPTFADGADLQYMFQKTTEHASVDLSHWNMSAVDSVFNMFQHSNATVNVSGAVIKEGRYMFDSFNGTLGGTPTFAAGADLLFMFENTPEHLSVDLSHLDMGAVGSVSTMFKNSNSRVNVSGTIIKKGYQMFDLFNGTLVGMPTFADEANLQYMFRSTPRHLSVDLSHWNMSGVGNVQAIFYYSKATVNVSKTVIKKGYRMFDAFNGTLVGTPTFTAEANLQYMFSSTPEHLSVDLSHWNMSAVNYVNIMFQNSKATVNVSGTVIKDGIFMFKSFNGTLVGTPTFTAEANLQYMFSSTPEHLSVDSSHWNMSNVSSVNGMFLNSNSMVNVSGTIIKDGNVMFSSFNGTLVGTPTFAAGAELTQMFQSTSEHLSVDLSHWDMSAVSSVSKMFINSNSMVNVSGTIIKDGNVMFSSFNGTLVGTPTFAAGAELTQMFQSTSEHLSVDLSHWNMSDVSSVSKMFINSNSRVNVSGTVIKKGDKMFSYFNGTLVGTPTFAAGASLFNLFSYSHHLLDIRLWVFCDTMVLTDMFYESDATVLVTPEQHTLLEDQTGFNTFHGSKEISGSSPSCSTPTTASSSSDDGLIIGLSAGGGVLVLAGLVYFFKSRATTPKYQQLLLF